MKRAVTILLIISQLLIFSSCDQNTTAFTESNHPRSESYNATFDTMCKTEGNLTVHIAEEVYEEKNADKVFQQIKEDYDKVIKVTGQKENSVTVYIVSKTIVGKVYCTENEIYCTTSDLETEDFRKYLVKETLNVTDMWQCIGLRDFIFENKSKTLDIDELKKYYSNSEHINTLSMFPAYFIEEFADEDTRKVANTTADLLTQYIIKEKGIEEYLNNGNSREYRSQWMKSIGIDEKYPWNDEETEFLNNIQFKSSQQYPLILNVDNWNYNFQITDWLQNADDMLTFWMKTLKGYQGLLEKLQEDNLLETKQIQEILKKEKQVNLLETADGTSSTDENVIQLRAANSIWHEMVHVFVPPSSIENKRWIAEGTADYYGLQLENKYGKSISQGGIFRYLTYDLRETDTDSESVFEKKVIDYYLKYSNLPLSEEEVDEILIYEAWGVVATLNPELKSGIYIVDTPIADIREEGVQSKLESKRGNSLSYPEAYVFVKYLVENYGIDTVVQATSEYEELEKIFGKSYEELYSDFLSNVSEKNI